MSLRNLKLFGLDVNKNLADVVNKNTSLNSLNLSVNDLDVIRGSSDAGLTRFDWVSLSRLSSPIYETLDRYYTDNNEFTSVLNAKLGVDSVLFGNLLINGKLSGNSIRYRYVEGSGPSAVVKISDISSSRASSWSSSDEPATDTSPIFYGARVGIVTGGSLEFGTPTSGTQIRLKANFEPQVKEFDSEFPTHKINCTINGQQVSLYAMKGIPVTFTGRFSTLSSAGIALTSLINNIPPSWKISLASPLIPEGENLLFGGNPTLDPLEPLYKIRTGATTSITITDSANRTYSDSSSSLWNAVKAVKSGSNYLVLLEGTSTNIGKQSVWTVDGTGRIFKSTGFITISKSFPNVGGIDSSIGNYNAGSTRERLIQIYYNPDYIRKIAIPSAGIFKVPENKFPNLTELLLANNNLKDFPNFTVLTPNLTQLDLSNNPLNQSSNSNERTLNSNILSKIPTSVVSLNIGNTFGGALNVNGIAERLPNLQSLRIESTSRPFLVRNNTGSLIPNVPNTCTIYVVRGNRFTGIGTTGTYPAGTNIRNIKDLDTLVGLSIDGPSLSDSSFSISSPVIQTVDISRTLLSYPNLSFKNNLTNFAADNTFPSSGSTLFTNSNVYKFEQCNSLETLSFDFSILSGPIPKFTNQNLRILRLTQCRLVGGSISTDTYVIPQNTFESCLKLEEISISSPALLPSPIHPDIFTNSDSKETLTKFLYNSNRRTSGIIPTSIASCTNLRTLDLYNNNFSGDAPRFSSNQKLEYVDLSYNSLSGSIPAYNLPLLTTLYLNNNQFTALNQLNLLKMQRFDCYSNLIAGSIPDFSNSLELQILKLYNNRFQSYTTGSFAKLTKIKEIDVSSNLLSQQAINSIVSDLIANYDSLNRSGVLINLRGNSIPSTTGQEQIQFLRTKGWTISFEGQ